MSDNDKEINELDKRKQELENELKKLENELDDNLHGARKDVTGYLNPKNLVQEYPLQSLGVSVLLGYLAGKRSSHNQSQAVNKTHEPTIVDLIWKEVKRDASRKLVKVILAYLDEKTSYFTESQKTREDDEAE